MKKINVVALIVTILTVTPSLMGMEKKEQNTGLIHFITNTFGRGYGYVSKFTREKGYWTTINDENSDQFLKKSAEHETQREDFYKKTEYVSEWWCALSNLPLIGVGVYHKSPEVAFAGLASFAYHSIPKQWLLYVDRLGVALTGIKALREWETIKNNPSLWTILPAILGINGIDEYLARVYGFGWLHPFWHLSAAYFAHMFLSKVNKK